MLARKTLTALALSTMLFPVTPASAETPLRSITVQGQGEVTVAPDMATVRLGVRSEAETTGEAMDQASKATANILALLAEIGVADTDVQSGSIRLSPVYGSSIISGSRQITGYSATNMVTVQVRDLSGLGTLLQASVTEGANSLNGVTFGLQDPQEHEDAARRLAVADAARRAALYAEAGGVEVGDMVSLTEQGAGGYAPIMMAEQFERGISAASYEVPVAAGEISLSASVVIVYEIAE